MLNDYGPIQLSDNVWLIDTVNADGKETKQMVTIPTAVDQVGWFNKFLFAKSFTKDPDE